MCPLCNCLYTIIWKLILNNCNVFLYNQLSKNRFLLLDNGSDHSMIWQCKAPFVLAQVQKKSSVFPTILATNLWAFIRPPTLSHGQNTHCRSVLLVETLPRQLYNGPGEVVYGHIRMVLHCTFLHCCFVFLNSSYWNIVVHTVLILLPLMESIEPTPPMGS